MIKLTDKQLKDLSILMSKVKSRVHGRDVTVTYKRMKNESDKRDN